MFKKRFIELCEERGVTPTSVCKSIGLSNSAFSAWSDTSLPRNSTVKKIADHFGVTPEYFTSDSVESLQINLSEHEINLVLAYRARPEMRPAVVRLLYIENIENIETIENNEEYVSLYAAASSSDNLPDGIVHMSREQWEKIKNAPETDEKLL